MTAASNDGGAGGEARLRSFGLTTPFRAIAGGHWRYGDVSTIFVLATLLTLGLALHLASRVMALRKALRT